ncbi:MAG: DNA-formamidopyrimidine glycosylase family protein [Propioniciclava sp.]|uniref:Fpg/Nei family DNA glycosylase n=1 Tax=Propioniciclava sp. TaxID=2038686 RepID=UPI0039E53674
MPEMPEVEALRSFLAANLIGRTVVRADLAAFSALKTFALPLSALHGAEVEAVERRGKFLALDAGGTWLVFHLARAGWLTWHDPAPATPVRPGKGPLALRVVFAGEPADPAAEGSSDDPSGPGEVAFTLTEAGTQKHLAVYVVAGLDEVPGIGRLGPDPLAGDFGRDDFAAVLAAHPRTQLKGLLKDQSVFAGIGNAYSDEILLAARLSPFKLAGSLSEEEVTALFAAVRGELTRAVERAAGARPSALKDSKRTHLRVHGRKGAPCEVCATPIAEVSFADSFLNYCPGCQTSGKLLADRRLSRLLK